MDILSFSVISSQIKREINHKCKLNLSQTRILLFFADNNNAALTMGELASRLNISLSTLSRQLQQNKTKTFVEINRSARNSSKSVRLNQTGIEKMNQLIRVLEEIKAKLLANLSAAEAQNFIAELNLLAKQFSL